MPPPLVETEPFSPSPAREAINLGDLRAGSLDVTVAVLPGEIEQAQQLRYRVFYEEMGAKPHGDIAQIKRDHDPFDPYCDHLVVREHGAGGNSPRIVGTYRMLRRRAMEPVGKFYSQDEFNISPLLALPGEILEVGRSCVDPMYRNRAVMQLLWRGIGAYVSKFEIELLFGCGSLPGTDPKAHAQALSYLHHWHLAPPPLRPEALPGRYVEMNLMERASIEEKAAFTGLPALIKGYLRLGGYVGKGAVIDYDYNTTDVCIVVKTDLITEKYGRRYRAGKDNEA